MALLQIASVRLLTDGLGRDAYAVYALLLGVTAWFTLADFGIPAALQNWISSARARGVPYAEAVSAWAAVALVGGTLLALLIWAASPWIVQLLMPRFTGVSEYSRLLSFRLMAVASIALAASSLIYKVWYAEQRGYLTHVCQLAASLAGYGATRLILQGPWAAKLEWSVLAYYGFNALLPAAFLLSRSLSSPWPSRVFDNAALIELLRSAAAFWGYALMAALVLQIDFVLIAYLLGPDDLVAYSIYARIFGLGLFVYTSVLGALWPVLSERAASGKGRDILTLCIRHATFGLIFMSAFSLLVHLYDRQIVALISPSLHLHVAPLFTLSCAAYFLIRVWSDTFAVLLQSMGRLSAFYVLVPLQAVFSVGAQMLASRWAGLSGIPIGMAVSFLLTTAWAAPLLARRKALELEFAR